MIDVGLRHAARKKWEADLFAPLHTMRVRVILRDGDEKPVSSITPQVLEGAVQVDADADVTRQLQLVVLDPKHRLKLDPRNPSHALFPDRFISVVREDHSPTLGRWVNTPVFWGPVTHVEREGAMLSIEGMGKEYLALDPNVAWKAQRIRRGVKKTDAMKDIMRPKGERRFDIPDLRERLRKGLSITRHDQSWQEVKRLARSLDRQAFYDGAGRLRLRKVPERSVFTFGEGRIIPSPLFATDFDAVRNVVEVLGPQPEGRRSERIRYVAMPSPSHPLSPRSLQRNGEWRYIVLTIEEPEIRTQARARQIGERELKKALRAALDAQFTAPAVSHLEPLDEVVVRWDQGDVDLPLRQFSIPLTSQPMTVGSLIKVRSRRAYR